MNQSAKRIQVVKLVGLELMPARPHLVIAGAMIQVHELRVIGDKVFPAANRNNVRSLCHTNGVAAVTVLYTEHLLKLY